MVTKFTKFGPLKGRTSRTQRHTPTQTIWEYPSRDFEIAELTSQVRLLLQELGNNSRSSRPYQTYAITGHFNSNKYNRGDPTAVRRAINSVLQCVAYVAVGSH